MRVLGFYLASIFKSLLDTIKFVGKFSEKSGVFVYSSLILLLLYFISFYNLLFTFYNIILCV
jgi:hypothetical protein